MVRAIAVFFLLVGAALLAQAYGLAVHGVYFDCVVAASGDTAACPIRSSGPTITSLALAAVFAAGSGLSLYLSFRAFRWRSSSAPDGTKR